MCVAHARTVVVVKTRLNLTYDGKYVGTLTFYYFGVENYDN